ncbi:MAG: glycosyltransferase [bacterium]|nr:glycosyltransferase [bacterium]
MKILYVAKLYPYPPEDGSLVRVYNILHQLSARHQITLAAQVPEGAKPLPLPVKVVSVKPRSEGRLKYLQVFNLFRLIPYHQQRYLTKALIKTVKDLCRQTEYDQVIVDSLYLASLVRYLPGRKIVVNEQNYEPQVMKDHYRSARNPVKAAYFYWQYLKVDRLMRWAAARPDLSFFCVSRPDADQVLRINPGARVFLAPNGVDVEKYGYAIPPQNETVSFLGSLAWAPNVDGLRWFLHDIWPALKSGRPGAKFKVIGQDPNLVSRQYSLADVQFTGRVEEVASHVLSSAVFVVPLRFGGGTKLKLLEAMALGRPVVTTAKGAEGIEGIENGLNAIITDDPVQFAGSVNDLLNDHEKAVRMGLAGRKLVEQRYDWTRIGRSMDDCLAGLTAKVPAVPGLLYGRDIICFSNDWQQDPLSKHHIMSRLARQNRVLWINSIGLRNPTATRMDVIKGFTKIRDFFTRRLEKVSGNLSVLNLLVLPFHGHRLINKINKLLLVSQVRFYQSKLGFAKPILWSFLPNAESAFGRMDEELSIYYLTDDFTKFTGHPARAIGRMEESLIEKADLVIASAGNLVDIKGRGKKIHLVGHGVDHRHFSRALEMTSKDWPVDVKDLKKPVIGFYGEINDWLDLEMLRRAAELKPDWSFVLVGRVAVEVGNLDSLRAVKNIRLLGQKKFDQLPAYCAAFDVGLIPMKLNDLTVCVNPLKLKEYLAAGLPVVSARLPEVQAYKDVVEFAGTAEELVSAVEKLLAKDRSTLKYELSRRVANESWDAKVVEISKLIQTALEQKVPTPVVALKRSVSIAVDGG